MGAIRLKIYRKEKAHNNEGNTNMELIRPKIQRKEKAYNMKELPI